MKIPLSRRSVLIGLGGLAATSLAWSLGGLDFGRNAPGVPADAGSSAYVDHEGWWLTVDDKRKILASVPLKRLENTNLPGSDIASRTVADADACALWCVTDPRCRSFTFSVPLPGRARPNTCWIKDSVPEPVSTERYYSGIVE